MEDRKSSIRPAHWLSACRQTLSSIWPSIPSPISIPISIPNPRASLQWLPLLLLLSSASPSTSSFLTGLQQTPLSPPSPPPRLGTSASCAPSTPLSCHNTSAVADTCCFNAPGGQLLLTQFWDTHPPTGPADSWTVHGLWPDHCDGSFDQYCDSTRAYHNITAILASAGADTLLKYMDEYWKDFRGNDENFWQHEWNKHGTCISTLDTACYEGYVPQQEVVDFFNVTVNLFDRLPTYEILEEAGVVPGLGMVYSLEEIQSPLQEMHGAEVTVLCRGGELDQVWYHFDVRGSVQTGVFVPAKPDGMKGNCPATGIRYLPKTPSLPVPTSTRGEGPSPTASSAPFTGKGNLEVMYDGKRTGCLISAGAWYVSGTCAGFRAQKDVVNVVDADDDDDDDAAPLFTLTSRKGPCGIVEGVFECGKHLTKQEIFSGTLDGKLSYRNSTVFTAEQVPGKFQKVGVHVDQAGKGEGEGGGREGGGGEVEIEVLWRGA